MAGLSLMSDLKILINKSNPVIFDVGCNRAQSTIFYFNLFKDAKITAFEPSTDLYNELKKMKFPENRFIINNVALGSEKKQLEFNNYNKTGFNSFLEVDKNKENRFGDYLRVMNKEVVEVNTLDNYVNKMNIDCIDLLKIDTQGFDLEVLKGAEQSLKTGKVYAIYIEMNFVRLYKEQAAASSIFIFLESLGRIIKLRGVTYFL